MSCDIKLSVLITYYNQKDFIKDSLDSVLNQKTDYSYEILIGDDGSTDGTYELLLELSRSRENITVYRMPRDENSEQRVEPITRVSQNRVFLYKKAKGKYITFLDGDDYYIDPYKIQNQIDALENNPKAIGCGTPIMMMHEDSSKDYIYGDFFPRTTIVPSKSYWANLWLHADTFIFRNIDFNDKELNAYTFDDNILTCHFLKYGDVVFLPTPTVAYRQLGDSSWGGRSDLEKMLINVLQYVEGINILKWPLVCFIRNFGELRTLYDKRDESVELKDFNEQLKCVLLSNAFVRRTVRYASKSKMYQLMYNVRYFLPLHSTRVVLKLKKFYMKKGKAMQL